MLLLIFGNLLQTKAAIIEQVSWFLKYLKKKLLDFKVGYIKPCKSV